MTASKTATIKPCPFCGGSAEIIYCGPTAEQAASARAWGQDYDCAYYGECNSCKATAMAGNERADAVEQWNRRVS